MNKVAIIDYGMCNLDSVARAVEECGGEPIITDQACDLALANRIILPGVGAFPDAMRNIKERSLDLVIREQAISNRIPFLGICLGMQLLASKGWEVRETEGLGLIEGQIKRLEPSERKERIPHVGWNEMHVARPSYLFNDIPSGKDFYFVHSYHFVCTNQQNVLAHTPYCGEFVSVVGNNNVFGVQFHPEKSQKTGFQILRNFLAL